MSRFVFVTYPGFTTLYRIGQYDVLRHLPNTEVRLVWR